MIQLSAFATAKEMARLPHGPTARQRFTRTTDLHQRWEKSLDSREVVEAIGSLSVSADHVPDVQAWLGELSAEERTFKTQFENLYRRVAVLATSLPCSPNTDPDVHETLLDTRVIQQHVTMPRCVLDIGPGSGRHLANLFLRPWGARSAYVGVESLGLPYVLQNLVGTALALQDASLSFHDQIEHTFGRADFAVPREPPSRSIWHLPLWQHHLLPEGAFDLILCNYVLDELSHHDFQQVADLLQRCLAPDGVIYCRGSQQRAQIKDLYQFGYGTFHQQDITDNLLKRGLQVKACDLLTAMITRVFVRADSTAHVCANSGYATLRSDVDLVNQMQTDFIQSALAPMASERMPVLIWGESDYRALGRWLQSHLAELNVVGLTNEHVVHEGIGPLGLRELPVSRVRELNPRAVLIAATRLRLAVRELREALSPAVLSPVRQFNWPFAFAYVSEMTNAATSSSAATAVGASHSPTSWS